MTTPELLLAVWREACRHLELEQSIDGIAAMVAPALPADAMVVRQVDLNRGALETVAVGACRPHTSSLPRTRNDVQGGAMRELLAWCRGDEILEGTLPTAGGLLPVIAPANYRGHCLAAPLHSDEGPIGVLLFLSAATRFADGDRQLLQRLAEPVTVALANTSRVHELKRLREALEADKQALLRKLGRHDLSDSVVGADSGLRDVMGQIAQVAATDVPVLIIGETGSGKEVLARALHQQSRRARAPIVRVNCGAIPPGLVDSELFGHERGSFTGAVATRHGWFERADGGTLFLDEIGELPLEAQVRLLRILQDGTFERVGGHRPLSVDVRIVAATHRDLKDMATRGTFREDLWYRISVFPVHLPPLRDRREDIPRLASHFAERAATRLGALPLSPTADDLDLLLAYDWPGNVRELAAVIERAAILGGGRTLSVAAALGPSAASPVPRVAVNARDREQAPIETLDAAMRRHIEHALRITGGRIEGSRGVAERLAINPHTLRARMRKLGIRWDAFRGNPQTPANAEPITPLSDAMAAHITRALETTNGRVEGPRGAAHYLAINAQTLRARMRKLRIKAGAYRLAPRAPIKRQ